MINVSRLYIHPVKSMKGTRLSQAFARESGFTFDRDFMITTPEGHLSPHVNTLCCCVLFPL